MKRISGPWREVIVTWTIVIIGIVLAAPHVWSLFRDVGVKRIF